MAKHRIVTSVTLAVSLSAAILTTAAACGGSPPAASPATTSATPSGTATSSQQNQQEMSQTVLKNVVKCMTSQGVEFSHAKATAKDVKAAFRSMPMSRQQKVFAACGHLLPAGIRQVAKQRIAQETAHPAKTP